MSNRSAKAQNELEQLISIFVSRLPLEARDLWAAYIRKFDEEPYFWWGSGKSLVELAEMALEEGMTTAKLASVLSAPLPPEACR